LLLLSGTSAAQLIPALFAPILTRQYSPHDFGAFAIVYAILGIFAAVACARYELAIVLPEDEEDAIRLIPLCIAICVGLATILELACLSLQWIAPGSKIAELSLVLMAMLPIGILFTGCQQVAQIWCVRTHQFRISTTAMTTQATVMILSQIGLAALWGSNPYFLVCGVQLGLVASVLVYGFSLFGTLAPRIDLAASFRHAPVLVKRFIRFPVYTAPYVFVTQAASRGNLLLLASLATTAVAGQFALAQRIVYFPISTVMASASLLFFSRAPGRMRDPVLQAAIARALRVAPLIVGPPFLALALFAEPVFQFFFGTNWAEAGRFAAILSIPALTIASTAWLDRTYDILGRQRLALLLEIANNAVSLSAVYLTLRISGSALHAVSAYAVATSLFLVIWTGVTLRIADLSLRPLVVALVTGAALAAVTFGIIDLMTAVSNQVVPRVLVLLAIWLPAMAIGAGVAFSFNPFVLARRSTASSLPGETDR
jgi:O-antigen/teichoic acid export membrane protein